MRASTCRPHRASLRNAAVNAPRIFGELFIIDFNCAGKKFDVVLESATSVDWQTIRVQENVQGHSETGRMPRTIEGVVVFMRISADLLLIIVKLVELLRDLVDSCVPGDTVTFTRPPEVIVTDALLR